MPQRCLPLPVHKPVSAQDVYERTEEDFHPCDKASMKAQMPELFRLSLVLRKGLCCVPGFIRPIWHDVCFVRLQPP